MEFICAGIDGTGVSSNEKYEKTFADSFVNRLSKQWSAKLSFYVRGPSNSGKETHILAERAYEHVVRNYQPGRGVILAGYSRGAAAMIDVASWLKRRNEEKDKEPIPVHCLVLFDSVDRALTAGALFQDTKIAANVQHCIHAMRDPSTGSRPWFGSCGQELKDPKATKYVSRYFKCSHGGMGGTPWDVAPDERVDERFLPFIEKPLGLHLTGGVINVTGAQDRLVSQHVWRWAMFELKIAEAWVQQTSEANAFQATAERKAAG